MENLNTDLLDKLSVRFLLSVKNTMGKDVGVDAINALQPVLGKDWAGRILYNMLRGDDIGEGIFIRCDQPNYRKISTIKIVRQLSGMTLTDAKRLVEEAEYDKKFIPISPREGQDIRLHAVLHELKLAGVKVEYNE